MTSGQPPYTTIVPLVVSNAMVDELIGQTIHCAHFRIDKREDGFYDMTISTDKGDCILNDAERQFS